MRVKPRRGGEADEERQADSDSEAAHHAVRSVSGMTAMPGASRIYSAAALRGLINEGERRAFRPEAVSGCPVYKLTYYEKLTERTAGCPDGRPAKKNRLSHALTTKHWFLAEKSPISLSDSLAAFSGFDMKNFSWLRNCFAFQNKKPGKLYNLNLLQIPGLLHIKLTICLCFETILPYQHVA